MRKLLLLLIILFLPCVVHAGGVNPVISADKTITDWAGVDTTFTDIILLGRSIATEYRKRHAAFYTGVAKSHDDMVAAHQSEIARVKKQLQAIGFKDEGDFIQQSIAKDIKAGLAEKDWWR